jgi:hypothetical protein
MNTYPANEQQISDVERGRCCGTVVSMPHGESLAAGDTVLFALSLSRAGQQPSYVKGGDSVLVSLTEVTALEDVDPLNGQSLVRLSWQPLGAHEPAMSASKTIAKTTRRTQGRARPGQTI